jgi:serine protease Do
MRLPAATLLVLALCLPPKPAAAQAPGSLVGRSSPLQVVEPDASERDLRLTPVVRAVQRAADSVVSIYLQHQLASGEAVTDGQGSGVILDASGLVITNWHVVAPILLAGTRGTTPTVQVRLRDGRARPAKVLSSSARRDLALLQLELPAGETVRPIEIARSSDLMVGETLIAIGNPQGHANTVTTGVLSAIDRSIRVRTPDGQLREYTGLLQTDAAINQGNSGGALLDITGRLVGINNAMAVGAENIGFAIPMDIVRSEFERELLQTSSTGWGGDLWLGIEVAERDGVVTVAQVLPRSPAARAGIEVGDQLVRLGAREVRSSLDYLRHFFTAAPHRPLAMTLRRGKRELDVAPVPLTRDHGTVYSALGILPQEVTASDDEELLRRATLAFYRDTGMRRVQMFPAIVRLQDLQPGSPAETIGLRPGDLVLSAFVRRGFGEREVPIVSLRDLAQLVSTTREPTVRLGILRGDEELVATIELRRRR